MIPSEQLFAICVSNCSIDVVIVENGAEARVGEDSPGRTLLAGLKLPPYELHNLLSTWAVYSAMTFQHSCPSATRAGCAISVDLKGDRALVPGSLFVFENIRVFTYKAACR